MDFLYFQNPQNREQGVHWWFLRDKCVLEMKKLDNQKAVCMSILQAVRITCTPRVWSIIYMSCVRVTYSSLMNASRYSNHTHNISIFLAFLEVVVQTSRELEDAPALHNPLGAWITENIQHMYNSTSPLWGHVGLCPQSGLERWDKMCGGIL